MMKIYMDNAATTKVDPEVVRAMDLYLTESYGNASSLHSAGTEAREAVEKARKTIADSINAEPSEIVFTSGGTESDNMAIKEIAFTCGKKGKHIITTKIEHPAVLNTCKFLECQGFKITYLNVNKEGIVNPEDVKKAITEETVLISIMHVNNEVGTVQPIEQISEIAKEHNILFHTDAVQSYMKLDIDVKKTKIDLLSASAHKIHGPKGIGFLYIRKGTKVCPMIHGGGHEHGLRGGTENVPSIVGMAKAVEVFKDIIKIKNLRTKLEDEIKKIPDATLNGDPSERVCSIANFTFKNIEGESLLLKLDAEGIAVSTGSACSSHNLQPSHVLAAMGRKPEESHGSIRFSLSRFNTEDDINFLMEVLPKAVDELRGISALK